MDSQTRTFGETLAKTILDQDWSGVHELLAPWLQSRYTIDDVQEFFESDYLSILAGSDIDELHHPETYYVGGNSSDLASLREPPSWKPVGRAIPDEVSDENFRQWMNVQLQCSEDQQAELDLDYLSDLWLVVVEHENELRVGYWAHDPYES